MHIKPRAAGLRAIIAGAIMLCGAMTTAAIPASASVLALDSSSVNDSSGFIAGGTTNGIGFTLSTVFAVDGLGYFDFGADGLADSHDVAIYTAGGVLVVGPATVTGASALVPSASTLGDWRFETVATTILMPGDYVVAGYDPTAQDLFLGPGPTADIPEITRDFGNRLLVGGGLAFPTNFNTIGLTVVSFRGHIPEPGTLALFGLGLVGLGVARRRKAAA